MGEHKRTEKPIQEKWRWEITKREQWRPEHRTIGILVTDKDPVGTLVEDSHGTKYWVSHNRFGQRAGLRKLSEQEAQIAEDLVRAARQKAAVSAQLVARPPKNRSEKGALGLQLRHLWKRATKGFFRGATGINKGGK